jgi:hypothetical protein
MVSGSSGSFGGTSAASNPSSDSGMICGWTST